MYYSVISLEDGVAVLERDDGLRVSLAQRQLPSCVREGDVLKRQGEEYCLAPEETEARKARVRQLFEKLTAPREE